MDPVEQSLLQALEANPDDWSVRLIIAEKQFAREGYEEAAATIASAPSPPPDDVSLEKAANLAGVSATPIVASYVQSQPSSGYGHLLLATLAEQGGDLDRARQHYEVAAALGMPVSTAEEDPVGLSQPEPEAGISIPPIASPSAPPPPDGVAAQAEYDEIDLLAPVSTDPPKKNSTRVTAIFVAIAVHLIIGLLAGLLIILPATKDEPEIVAAVIGPPAAKIETQKKNVARQVKRSTSAAAAAAPVAQLMRTNAMAQFSAPEVTRTSTGPLGLGEGNFGSGGFGGTGSGFGSGASFFGGSSSGSNFAFVLDYSGSMKRNQIDLIIKEMDRTLDGLNTGTQFQIILFAGGATYAVKGWKVDQKGKNNTVTDPDGKRYQFDSVRNSFSDYDFKGADSNLPSEEWQPSNPAARRAAMEILKRRDLFVGTDWRWPFKMAMNLSPAPDVVFFMSDGTGGAKPDEIIKYAKKKNARVQINMFAMETIAGAREMAQIAEATGGIHKIILRSGETVDGAEVFTNRREVEERIRKGR
ncbi:MAG: vWA domain-containing protein [Verrucomicrobiota bacterium]